MASSSSGNFCPSSSSPSPAAVCAVCGDQNAKLHYGVPACLGCKGFFRRALKKLNEYECLRDNNCTIDKQGRNSCRSCRLQKCLDVGMDPAAVRPDRDFAKHARRYSLSSTPCSSRKGNIIREEEIGGGKETGIRGRGTAGTGESGVTEGAKGGRGHRLSVEMRTMLMTLQNIEAKVVRGDTAKDASEIYPLRINTIREVINDPTKLQGRRTEMRYEPYRMARNEELSAIVYRRLIAAIDWVELLAECMGGLSTEDPIELNQQINNKIRSIYSYAFFHSSSSSPLPFPGTEDRIALVKSCFGPLTLFKCSARTAIVTENEDLLCLCNFAYVPREISKAYHDAYHLDNGLVERLLTELVTPFRRIHLLEEEVICISAIIVLNPMARELSEAAAEKCFQLRNRISATLHQMVKECRSEHNPNTWFGNLLLYLPTIASLANAMSENLRFAQTFSTLGDIPLLTSLFGCFPVEPFAFSELALCPPAQEEKEQRRGTNEEEEKGEERRGGEGASDDKNGEERKKRMRKKKKTEEDSAGRTKEGTTQTEEEEEEVGRRMMSKNKQEQTRKRRLLVTNSLEDEGGQFRLLKAPCSYTLTEMFDDRMNEEEEEGTEEKEEGRDVRRKMMGREEEEPEGDKWKERRERQRQQPQAVMEHPPTTQIQQLNLGAGARARNAPPLPPQAPLAFVPYPSFL